VLFAKAGYGQPLCELADRDTRIELVDMPGEPVSSSGPR
jgi:hypothetical protein